jgi:luciferase-like monooxygenase
MNEHQERTTAVSIADRIAREVMSLPGVTAESHRGGMIFFHVGRREIGHLHGERLADLPFPVRIREKLVAAKKADVHYLHPKTGWVSYYIRSEDDVDSIVELFRLNYERPWLRK